MRSFSRRRARNRTLLDSVYLLLILTFRGTQVADAMAPHSFRNAGRVAPFGLPDPSRTLPTTSGPPSVDTVMISSRCSCGSVLVEFPYPNAAVAPNAPIIDCHCASCRRFHVSAFVRYMEVPENDVSISGDSVVRFTDSCSEAGPVHRMYCRRCSSKLLTTVIGGSGSMSGKSTVLVNMGGIDSMTVPEPIADQWTNTEVTLWRPNMEASWTRAVPVDDDDDRPMPRAEPPAVTASGGCTCGACQYEFEFSAPSEMQHCYCNLCRQLSGGMFMTWIPVAEAYQNFRWIRDGTVTKSNAATPQRASSPDAPRTRPISEGEAPLVRYTDIGQRHVCSQCGGVLSILYDCENTFDEDAAIWLAVAGFDSIRFPFNVEPYLDRILHICCRFKPDWYTLPDDDMPKVEDAS